MAARVCFPPLGSFSSFTCHKSKLCNLCSSETVPFYFSVLSIGITVHFGALHQQYRKMCNSIRYLRLELEYPYINEAMKGTRITREITYETDCRVIIINIHIFIFHINSEQIMSRNSFEQDAKAKGRACRGSRPRVSNFIVTRK